MAFFIDYLATHIDEAFIDSIIKLTQSPELAHHIASLNIYPTVKKLFFVSIFFFLKLFKPCFGLLWLWLDTEARYVFYFVNILLFRIIAQ